MSEVAIKIRLRSNILGSLLEMRSATRKPNYALETYVGELLEAAVADFRIRKLSPLGTPPHLESSQSGCSSRRGLALEVIRKIENLRFVMPVSTIAKKFGVNKRTISRVIAAARRREEHNRGEDKYPLMRGLM